MVITIKDEINVSDHVYNTRNKLSLCDRFFMNEKDVKE